MSASVPEVWGCKQARAFPFSVFAINSLLRLKLPPIWLVGNPPSRLLWFQIYFWHIFYIMNNGQVYTMKQNCNAWPRTTVSRRQNVINTNQPRKPPCCIQAGGKSGCALSSSSRNLDHASRTISAGDTSLCCAPPPPFPPVQSASWTRGFIYARHSTKLNCIPSPCLRSQLRQVCPSMASKWGDWLPTSHLQQFSAQPPVKAQPLPKGTPPLPPLEPLQTQDMTWTDFLPPCPRLSKDSLCFLTFIFIMFLYVYYYILL